MFGVINKSQYYNNFQEKFTPFTPKKTARGAYVHQNLRLQEMDSNLDQDSKIFSTTMNDESFDTNLRSSSCSNKIKASKN